MSRFEHAWSNRGRLLVFMALILSLSLAGCSMSFKYGRIPDTNSLTSLKQQVSTKGDVLNILGPPRGYGRMQPYQFTGEYDLWLYEFYETNTTGEVKIKMLLVFFDKEKFDGYMWFSSFEKFMKS